MKTTVSVLVFVGLFLGISRWADAQILDSPRDGVYDPIHLQDKKPIPYSSVREADVVWEKRVWRIMDLRQN